MNIRSFFVIALAASGFAYASNMAADAGKVSETVPPAKEWKTVRIGVEPAFKPFTFKTPEGVLTGFDIDIANELCTAMQVKCEFVEEADWNAFLVNLNKDKYDAIVSSMYITDERKQFAAFTKTYYQVPSRIVVRADSKIKKLPADLKGKRLGVAINSAEERYALGELAAKGAKITRYKTHAMLMEDMAMDKLDAAAMDALIAATDFLGKTGNEDWSFAGPAINDKSNTKYFGIGPGIAVRKQDEALRVMFDKAIVTIRQNGQWKKVNDKYFSFDAWVD
ncbi:transporter substrate-binding domain-containing protein [Chitinimonas sp. JJ19]|uniref:transporter substrate-binding domain-containing protein n=1 Tax=Chitinimonas sp. JJ19 TaxID=3109352 RepID=UPI001A491CC9|nr:transporter substrate-binding domain-containing protein [Chitinimonas sp.]